MSERESAKSLAERWQGKNGSIGDAPFGKTSAGLRDFRGWAVPEGAIPPGSFVQSADFARATYELIRLKRVTFERCSFEGAVFRGAHYTDCVFRECSFVRTAFRRCSWGGERNVYDECRFEKCTLVSSTTLSLEFINSRFDENKIHARFRGTVFENCRFSGKLESCNFIGSDDLTEEQKRYLKVRKPGGFYNVDLSNLSLEMNAFMGGFLFEDVTPPADGLSILLPRSQYADLILHLSRDNAAHSEEARILLSALRLWGDGYTICNRNDLDHFFGKDAGQIYFDQIKRAAPGRAWTGVSF